ncbi:MAG: ATP-dependent zinc metalloprotease FtsH [Candidatus Sungiibacteriota bacterium]|uniref:ATP-dependent zinc metalloprotease FtsH n=1 Tax=Candidatus Sungiibacteriota bacterium TaxID=2750080 RepID=A0A7T5RJX0_9BACT|nr:MAG: ATP-dependent zinc metalloprotease FtsH [Candidatus Sungbacteria bacterium]
MFMAIQSFKGTTPSISYTDFLKQIETGGIVEIRIKADSPSVRAYTKDGQWESVVVPAQDKDFFPLIKSKNIRIQSEETSWLTGLLFAWILPMAALFILWQFLMRKLGQPGGGLASLGKSRAKIYIDKRPGVSFADVAGVDESKEELEEVIEFLRNPQKFQRLGAKIPKGVLLVGRPGTGKTLLAKAVAGEASVPFISIAGSDFVEMFVGLGAARVRDLFSESLKLAPCIVFIDELDAVGKARSFGIMGGHEEREQTLNQLLVEMDGFEPNSGVIVVAATNRPEILDPALLRPGRFDRKIEIPVPDLRGREAILKIHTQKVTLAQDVDLVTIARGTPLWVGADLANLVNEAVIVAVRNDRDRVSMADFEQAKDRLIMGAALKNRVISGREKEVVAHHEAGHTVVAAFLKEEGADPIHKVTIVPRGMSLGSTHQLPEADRYIASEKELKARLAVLLGGRLAEELIFSEISTGASDDLKRATDLARRMVTEFGMGSLGLRTLVSEEQPKFLPVAQSQTVEASEALWQKVDEGIDVLLKEQRERVSSILVEKKAALKRIASELLEKEEIDGARVQVLMRDSA